MSADCCNLVHHSHTDKQEKECVWSEWFLYTYAAVNGTFEGRDNGSPPLPYMTVLSRCSIYFASCLHAVFVELNPIKLNKDLSTIFVPVNNLMPWLFTVSVMKKI